jgi:hypothetical protein
MYVDEPDVIVTVLGCKAPCPAAGFDSNQDLYIVFLFDLLESLEY